MRVLRGLEALVPFTSAANAIACISVGRQAARDRGSLREGEEGFEQGRDHEADFLLSIGPVQLDKISRLERGNLCGDLSPFGTDGWPVVGRQNKNRELPANDLLLVFEVLIGRVERLELPFCLPEQIAVLQRPPTHLLCRTNSVAW